MEVTKLEDFWDGLEVRKADDDRELQRKVVLGADALVNVAVRGFMRGVMLGNPNCVPALRREPVWAPLKL